MKITKFVEVFDCFQFKVGKIYYIHWHDASKEYNTKALYLCIDVDDEYNCVMFREVLMMCGVPLKANCSISDEDLSNIIDVQPAEFEIMFDQLEYTWQITTKIEQEHQR